MSSPIHNFANLKSLRWKTTSGIKKNIRSSNIIPQPRTQNYFAGGGSSIFEFERNKKKTLLCKFNKILKSIFQVHLRLRKTLGPRKGIRQGNERYPESQFENGL